MPRLINHDPNARLDYCWDWGQPDWAGRSWLGPDEIVAAEILVNPPGSVVVEAPIIEEAKVTAFVASGMIGATVGITCRITTASGRIDDRTLWLKIRER